MEEKQYSDVKQRKARKTYKKHERGRIFISPGLVLLHLQDYTQMGGQVQRRDCSAKEPPQGPFDVFVPQAVDERVQHGSDHRVHH